LERKFESELAERVSRKRGRGPAAKMLALAAAVGTCALLIASAALTFAWNENSNRPTFIVNDVLFDHVKDAVYNDEGSVSSMRSMTLKIRSSETPGDAHEEFTKLVYVINISVNQEGAEEVVAGSTVGTLSVQLVADEAQTAIGTIDIAYEVYDSSAAATLSTAGASEEVAFGTDASVDVDAVLPGIEGFAPDAGDALSLTITISFSEPLLHGDVSEMPWPSLDLGLSAYDGTF
jgi:hypothetical protein